MPDTAPNHSSQVLGIISFPDANSADRFFFCPPLFSTGVTRTVLHTVRCVILTVGTQEAGKLF
jgi:hypothetical protein